MSNQDWRERALESFGGGIPTIITQDNIRVVNPVVISFIEQLLEEERRRVEKELGDFAHTHYLGCHQEYNKWHYSYDTELVYIIDEFFKALTPQPEDNTK